MSGLTILFQENLFQPLEFSSRPATSSRPGTRPRLPGSAESSHATLPGRRPQQKTQKTQLKLSRDLNVPGEWMNTPKADMISKRPAPPPVLPALLGSDVPVPPEQRLPVLPVTEESSHGNSRGGRPVTSTQQSDSRLNASQSNASLKSTQQSEHLYSPMLNSAAKKAQPLSADTTAKAERLQSPRSPRTAVAGKIQDWLQPRGVATKGRSGLVVASDMQQHVLINRGSFKGSLEAERLLEEEEWNKRFAIACSRRKGWEDSAAECRLQARAQAVQKMEQERSRLGTAKSNRSLADDDSMQSTDSNPKFTTLEQIRAKAIQERRKVRETAALAQQMASQYALNRTYSNQNLRGNRKKEAVNVSVSPPKVQQSQSDGHEGTSSSLLAQTIIKAGRDTKGLNAPELPATGRRKTLSTLDAESTRNLGLRRGSNVAMMMGGSKGSPQKGKRSFGGALGRLKEGLLRKVGHKQTLQERIKRLRKLRRQAAGECSTPDPFGKNGLDSLSEEDKLLLQDVFDRYDADGSGELDTNELKEALNDLGLAPRSREEKQGLAQVLLEVDQDGGGDIDKEEFQDLVVKVMSMLREASQQEFFEQFSAHDMDDSGSLDKEELYSILTSVNMAPRTQDERQAIDDIIEKVDLNHNGEIDFGEFESFMTKARERLGRMRRKRQREIAEEAQLDPETLAQFKLDLDEVKDTYDKYDEDNNGFLDMTEVKLLVTDVGLRGRTKSERDAIQNTINDSDVDKDGVISFPEFLVLLTDLRKLQEDLKSAELRQLFHEYDSDGSGELSFAECSRMLEALQLSPKTRSEQKEIAILFEAVDSDGSGELDFAEFSTLCMRVTEKLTSLARKEELEAAKALNISFTQVEEYRQAFETLDPNGTGELGMDSVRRMMDLLRINISGDALTELFDEVDEDESGLVEFKEFLKLMQLVEAYVQSQNNQKRHASIYAPHRTRTMRQAE